MKAFLLAPSRYHPPMPSSRNTSFACNNSTRGHKQRSVRRVKTHVSREMSLKGGCWQMSRACGIESVTQKFSSCGDEFALISKHVEVLVSKFQECFK